MILVLPILLYCPINQNITRLSSSHKKHDIEVLCYSAIVRETSTKQSFSSSLYYDYVKKNLLSYACEYGSVVRPYAHIKTSEDNHKVYLGVHLLNIIDIPKLQLGQ